MDQSADRREHRPKTNRAFGVYLNFPFSSPASPFLFVLFLIVGLLLLVGFVYCWSILLNFWGFYGLPHYVFGNNGEVSEKKISLTKATIAILNGTTLMNGTALLNETSILANETTLVNETSNLATKMAIFATEMSNLFQNETFEIKRLSPKEEGERDETIKLVSILMAENEPSHKSCDDDTFNCKTKAPWEKDVKLLPWTRRCDGVNDCWDKSDEKNCTACLTSFSCSADDGKHLNCLNSDKICDKFADCADFSDETLFCEKKDKKGNCPAGTFDCKYRGRCIPERLRCDGNKDCHNNADEEECEWCQANARACDRKSSGYLTCVSVYKMCDGKIDCNDHRDEKFFHCNSPENCPGSCHNVDSNEALAESQYFGYLKRWSQKIMGSSKHLHCSDGKWYNPLYACNGEHPQCDNQCEQCAPLTFKCAVDNKCIPKSQYHDGVKNCPDGSDEANCTVTLECDHDDKLCDGFPDCKDGRDELNCTSCHSKEGSLRTYYERYHYYDYEEDKDDRFSKGGSLHWLDSLYHAYHCNTDQKCIPVQSRCDGKVDCPIGEEDEKNCTCAECMMHPHKMYVCQEGKRCFQYDEVCDQHFGSKCPNATRLDEEHCQLLRLN